MLRSRLKPRSIFSHLVFAAGLAWAIAEQLLLEYIFAWFVAINIVAFVAFGKDKISAKLGWGRTPEMTFHTLGVLGAFPAILASRKIFNHKTKKTSFLVPMWILFFAQIIAGAWFFGNLSDVVEKWKPNSGAPQTETNAQETPLPQEK